MQVALAERICLVVGYVDGVVLSVLCSSTVHRIGLVHYVLL